MLQIHQEVKALLRSAPPIIPKPLSDLGLTGSAYKGVITGNVSLAHDANAKLATLNGVTGVRMADTVPDISYTLSNGATGSIKLAGVKTAADIIAKIKASSAFLNASLDTATGKLSITDSSGGTGVFTLSAANNSNALSDLGLNGPAVGSVIAGTNAIAYNANDLLPTANSVIGVRINDSLPDIDFTLSNGDTGSIQLAGATTLDDIISRINASSAFLSASLDSATGKLKVTDSSGGTGTFSLSAANNSNALSDLGLNESAVGGDITGNRVLSTDANALLSTLNSVTAVRTADAVPDFTFTLHNGTTGGIKLAGAKTLNDVIAKINASSGFLHASLNSIGKLSVTDSSTGTGDFTLNAANSSYALSDLGLNGTAAGGVITGSRILSTNGSTLLSDLNSVIGVRLSHGLPDISYTLSNGDTGEIKLTGAKTLGDIIDKINAANTNLKASINSDGRRIDLNRFIGRVNELISQSSQRTVQRPWPIWD